MGLVYWCIIEAIDCHHKRDFPALEEVYRRKTTLQSSRVREDDRSQRLVGEFVPHEPKTFLTRSTKEVENKIGIEGDAPKTKATVVVVLSSMPDRSSMPELSSLSISSVRNGRISLTDPTMVVLPTPNPPAIKILTALADRVCVTDVSELTNAIKNRLQ
jgi:hypothetical protein